MRWPLSSATTTINMFVVIVDYVQIKVITSLFSFFSLIAIIITIIIVLVIVIRQMYWLYL